MQELFDLAESEGIMIEDTKVISGELLGLYVNRPEIPPVACVSSIISGNRRLYNCVLAEELGHHFTTPPGNYIPYEVVDHRKKLDISRIERKAERWSALFLVPQRELDKALLDLKLATVWELADHFNVTDELMRDRLELIEIMGDELYHIED